MFYGFLMNEDGSASRVERVKRMEHGELGSERVIEDWVRLAMGATIENGDIIMIGVSRLFRPATSEAGHIVTKPLKGKVYRKEIIIERTTAAGTKEAQEDFKKDMVFAHSRFMELWLKPIPMSFEGATMSGVPLLKPQAKRFAEDELKAKALQKFISYRRNHGSDAAASMVIDYVLDRAAK